MKFIFIELERKFQQQKENLLYSTLSITMLCKYIQESFTNEVTICCSILNLFLVSLNTVHIYLSE